MKKLIFFVVVVVSVLVIPAWAAVTIIATTEQVNIGGEPTDTDTFIISYENTEVNNVRAFALDITVAAPVNDPNATPVFVDYNEASVSIDYWVHPGSIDINEAGEVNDLGTPIGDPCQLPSDTKGGLDTNGVTVEMGSLYVGAINEPATSGVLLKLIVSDNATLSLAANVSRGGAAVMEGVGSKATVNLNGGASSMFGPADPNERAQWRHVGRPKCWCRFKGGRQCNGDADNAPYGKLVWYVSVPDADVFNSAQSKPLAEIQDPNGKNLTVCELDPNICASAWANVLGICADFDHQPYGKLGWRVSVPDADIFNLNDSQDGLPNPTCY